MGVSKKNHVSRKGKLPHVCIASVIFKRISIMVCDLEKILLLEVTQPRKGKTNFISGPFKCTIAAICFLYISHYPPAMAPLGSTRACRKYVDLINISSAKYINWDPLRPIEVG